MILLRRDIVEEMTYSQLEGILYNYKIIKASIENNKIKLDDLELEDPEDGMPSISYGDPSSQTNKINRSVETAALKNIERRDRLEKELIRTIRRETNKIKKIDNAMSGLSETEKEVATLFYIENKTWIEISGKMSYSQSWCQEIRYTAMNKMLYIINGCDKSGRKQGAYNDKTHK